ncbi:hypothetical protein C1J03_15800 [Sulfitobacter sp. SK012]|nr:hypothetical protein C1J03_15800 [Sulfitobacter sp. SK012]
MSIYAEKYILVRPAQVTALFLLLLLLVLTGAAFRLWSKRHVRSSLLKAELADHQRAIVSEQVPLTKILPPELRGKLEGKINLFLEQIEFVGCNGLEISEEMQLSIAAQACLLVVNNDAWYSNLHSILIYPSAFKSRQAEQRGYVTTEREIVRTGESWSRGPVVLSWAHSKQGASAPHDGHNVVFHEFAHQIDDLSGRTNGIPVLNRDQSVKDWGHVFAEAFERHVKQVHAGRSTLIDAYGAQGMEEFFAVVVEVFFERPAELKRRETEVYDQLATLFQLEPASWAQT